MTVFCISDGKAYCQIEIISGFHDWLGYDSWNFFGGSNLQSLKVFLGKKKTRELVITDCSGRYLLYLLQPS